MGRQRGTTSVASTASVSDGASDYLAQLQERRRQEIEDERLANEQRQLERRQRQAQLAAQDSRIIELPKGSLERKIALQMIEEYPNAEPFVEKRTKFGRTEAARRAVLDSLTGNEVFETGRINFATNRAKAALKTALDQLDQETDSDDETDDSEESES